MSITPCGEDILSEYNQKVREYNQHLKQLVEEKFKATYLPLGERLSELLEKHYRVKVNQVVNFPCSLNLYFKD